MTGRVRTVPSRSGQSLCLPSIAGVPLQVLKSAVALVLRIGTGGSEQLAHDEWEGSSSLFRKAFSASRKWCGITAAGQSRHDLECDQRLSAARPESQGPMFDETGGTHQSGLGTEGVRLLWSLHHHCCHQEGVRE